VSPHPGALYVHFPFCLSICPYCDFVVFAGNAAQGRGSRIDAFVDAVLVEIERRARPGSGLNSVYLGGGTPSLMTAKQVSRIMDAADRAFGIATGAEVTIEANPGPDERGDLPGFRAAGVNRLSIGAQSFQAAELKHLGRRHSAADIAAAVDSARSSGFENISLDLLYDVPGQTRESWQSTVTQALSLSPEHISAYALTLNDSASTADHLPVSGGAARWRRRSEGEQDDERAADMYEAADSAFSAAGLEWYELSNWSRPARQSRHNLVYWTSEAWEAVGPGAHAFDGLRTRRWNAARLDSYLAPLGQMGDGLPPGGSDTADESTAAAERAILRLRTRGGLTADSAGSFTPALAWARANGLVEPSDEGGVRLTMRGRMLSNEVFVRLLPAVASEAA
jgi:oxygen-independent coproporphyrinogen-3 oxidase